MTASTLEIIATALFAIALVHIFSSSFFEHLAHKHPQHAGLCHLIGEIEAVFGFWAMILVIAITIVYKNPKPAVEYLESRNYTEPLFVFAIMVVAASKPILHFASKIVSVLARAIGWIGQINQQTSIFFLTLSFVPLLGSFITEPAAMTLAALLLKDTLFSKTKNTSLMYLTIGVLFVNVSIGGALTNFAAPPILMVTNAWGWDTAYVFQTFGIKAVIAVLMNALLITIYCYKKLPTNIEKQETNQEIPWSVTLIHLLFLVSVVLFAHHPVVFIGLLLFFLGYTHAYPKYQNRLLLKEALMVAFFLAGLVVLGGMQQWWLQPILEKMSNTFIFYGAIGLTAMTDNAALTYLGSLVQGTNDGFKYALVTGAITGGGLTVIANAPNPAGLSLLKEHFPDKSVSALRLFIVALPPTIISIIAFQLF